MKEKFPFLCSMLVILTIACAARVSDVLYFKYAHIVPPEYVDDIHSKFYNQKASYIYKRKFMYELLNALDLDDNENRNPNAILQSIGVNSKSIKNRNELYYSVNGGFVASSVGITINGIDNIVSNINININQNCILPEEITSVFGYGIWQPKITKGSLFHYSDKANEYERVAYSFASGKYDKSINFDFLPSDDEQDMCLRSIHFTRMIK